jgi:hypothetical protein
MLAVNAGLFHEAQWSNGAGPAARAAGWWLLDDTSWNALARMPKTDLPAAHFALASAGYHGARENGTGDGWFCVVDAGPHGGDQTGHAHTDLGHVEIARGNVPIIADPGSSSYTADLDVRDNERSERAHACLFLPDAALARPRGPFSWQSVAVTPRARSGTTGATWWCEVSYTRPAGKSPRAPFVRHRRTIVLVRSLGVVVHDEIEGAGDIEAYVHWPIPHAIADLHRRKQSIEGPGFGITWVSEPEAGEISSCLEATSYSPAYGVRRPASLLRIAVARSSPATVVTVFTAQSPELLIYRSEARELTLASGGIGARLSFREGAEVEVQSIEAGAGV